MNKRGQGLSTNAIVLIVLGVVVLGVLIIGFTMGWEKIAPWLGKSNIDTVKQQCSVACATKSVYEYCNVVRDIKGLDDSQIEWLKESSLKGFNFDEKFDLVENKAQISCNTLADAGYLSCDVDCRFLMEQGLEKVSKLDIPSLGLSKKELIVSVNEFEEKMPVTLDVAHYQVNYSHAKTAIYTDIKLRMEDASNKDPLIIILGDCHGTPEVQYEILEDLKEDFGINFVGIEGWAGFDVDKKRGYQLLNADEKLNKWLLIDASLYTSVRVVPLEDEGAQEMALKLHLLYYNMLCKEILLLLESEMGEENARDFIYDSEIWPDLKDSPEYNDWEYLKKNFLRLLNSARQIAWELQIDYLNDSEIHKILQEVNEYFGGFKEKDIKHIYDLTSPEYLDCNKKEILISELIVDKRSCIMAEKMDEAMIKNKKDVGVMVVGDGHADQIILLLTQKGYSNIVYISPEYVSRGGECKIR
ncbi:MAG: hypothetical protein ABIG37_01050 [Nanoarchaeota archaeon]